MQGYVTATEGAALAPFVVVPETGAGDPEGHALLAAGICGEPGPALAGDTPRTTLLVHAPPLRELLRIDTFGATQVPAAGEDARWLGQRTGQLLKLLVARRYEIVPGPTLASAVWGYEGFSSSGAVRRCVCDLRGRLGAFGDEAIRAQQGGYALEPGVVSVDADDFRAHLSRALRALAATELDLAHAHLALAARLYRGAFLADEPDAVWAQREREELQEDIEAVHSRLATLRWSRGDLRGATGSLRTLSELAPYDEAVHRRLAGFLLAQGRLSAANRTYTAYAGRLERDLGILPGFALSDLTHVPGDLTVEIPRP